MINTLTYNKTNAEQSHVNDNFNIFYEDDEVVLISDMTHYFKMNNNSGDELKYQGWIEIMFCFDGLMQWETKGSSCQISKNSLAVMSLRSLEHLMVSLDTKMISVCVSNQLLYRLLGGDIDSWHKVVSGFDTQLLKLDKISIERFTAYFHLIQLHNGTEGKYDDKIVHSIVKIVLYALLNCFGYQKVNNIETQKILPKVSQGKRLFDCFLNLLNQAKPKRHPVGYFAERLSITSKYLSNLCLKYSGKSAADWIQEATQEEVRYYLKQTMLSMKDVAHTTGFDNEAFFGKYVKHHFGCTPLEYRRKNR